MLLRRDCVLSHQGESLLPLRCLFHPGCSAPLYVMDIYLPDSAHFAKVAYFMKVKTLYTPGWASLDSLLLVITASLTSSWVPRRSVRGCITFNGLGLSLTETIKLYWQYRGVHGTKLCLGSFFSARYVSCFLEGKVVAFRDTFLTYIFVVCAKYECLALFRPASRPGTRSSRWEVLPLW